jgi:beta-fructofuranosidase
MVPTKSLSPCFFNKMHWSLAVLSFVLGSIPSTTAQNSTSQLPDVLTADIIQNLGNNTLFNRWRPTYHFISPAGWMNVCAPYSEFSTAV